MTNVRASFHSNVGTHSSITNCLLVIGLYVIQIEPVDSSEVHDDDVHVTKHRYRISRSCSLSSFSSDKGLTFKTSTSLTCYGG